MKPKVNFKMQISQKHKQLVYNIKYKSHKHLQLSCATFFAFLTKCNEK
jgi:hypothetical protein